jgi:S1-C subfamily serine protease
VRVIHSTTDATRYALGALVHLDSDCGIVATAAHTFRPPRGLIRIIYGPHEVRPATLAGIDENWDVAFLKTARPTATAAFKVSLRVPRAGDPLTAYGFGSGEQIHGARGRFLRYAHTTRVADNDMFEVSGAVREGDSGGPIVDRDGDLVGIVWGTDVGCCVAASVQGPTCPARPNPRPNPAPSG